MGANLENRIKYQIYNLLLLLLSFLSSVQSGGILEALFRNGNLNSNMEAVGTREFGEVCDAVDRCNESKYYLCIDGRCMCRNPMQRAYDEDLRQCVSLAGSTCGVQNPPCVKNSTCSAFGVCKCNQNLVETATKVCLIGYGQPCQPNQCAADRGLVCIEGTCQCADNILVYKPIKKMCLNPQTEFTNFVTQVGRDVVQNTVSQAAQGLLFLPVRALGLIPGIGVLFGGFG